MPYNKQTFIFEKTGVGNIVKEIEAVFKGAFGNDFIVDPSTPQGQFISELAKKFDKVEDEMVVVESLVNINNLHGVLLDYKVEDKSLVRRGAEVATFDLEVSGTGQIPQNTVIISEKGGLNCKILSAVNVSGKQVVKAQTVNAGGYTIEVGEVFKLSSPIQGITSLKSLSLGIGNDRETDAELIDRYNAVNIKDGQYLSIMKEALLRYCQDVLIINNNTEKVLNGVPVGEIGVIAYQIKDEDVFAKELFSRLDVATPTHGDITKQVTDLAGIGQEVKYSKATEVNVMIEIILQPKGVVNNALLDKLKDDIMNDAKGYGIDRDVYWDDIDKIVLKSDEYYIYDWNLYKSGETKSANKTIAISYNEIAIFNRQNITITFKQ